MKVHCRFSGCVQCCLDTEMLLNHEDISRLEELGYAKEEFCFLNDDGFWQIKNEDGHCVFLKDGACSVYEYRPFGCRVYPLILDVQHNKVVVDDDCKYPSAFKRFLEKSSVKRAIRVFVDSLYEQKQ